MFDLSTFSSRDFDRGASRVKEGLWIICSNLLFRTKWPMPSALRCFFLRLFGAKIGRAVVIRSGVHITFPWRLTIGNHVWIGEDVRILNLADVTIGSNVCISQQAFLCTGNHDYKKPTFDLITKPIEIADSVWIAARAFIAPGVKIDANNIIRAGSVVTKSLEPGSKPDSNVMTQRSEVAESIL
jgi:putative colanic acid biosynthesis acetyltransferase WcaF